MSFDPDALPVPDFGLRCRICGSSLAGLSSHECSTCGQKFILEEHIPAGDFPVVIFEGRELRNTPEVIGLLRRYQIPYLEILPDPQASIRYHGALAGAASVGVIRDSYFEAIDILRRQKRNEPLPPVPPRSDEIAEWRCSACWEENPGNFDVCWNCGAASAGSSPPPG
jgi:hypothetical protein